MMHWVCVPKGDTHLTTFTREGKPNSVGLYTYAGLLRVKKTDVFLTLHEADCSHISLFLSPDGVCRWVGKEHFVEIAV